MPFSLAQHLITSTSGTTMAMMHDCKNKIYVRVVFASIMADLQRFAVDVELAHVLGPDVDVLDLFGDDVLALGQLEDVFPPVDDFQSSVLEMSRLDGVLTGVEHLPASTYRRRRCGATLVHLLSLQSFRGLCSSLGTRWFP